MGRAALTGDYVGGGDKRTCGLLHGADDQIGGSAVLEGGCGQGAPVLAKGAQQGGRGGGQRVRVHLAADRSVQRLQQRAVRLAENGGGGEPTLRLAALKVPLPPQGRIQIETLLRRHQGLRLGYIVLVVAGKAPALPDVEVLASADHVLDAVVPVVRPGGEVEDGLAVRPHAEALQRLVLDAHVGVRVVLLHDGVELLGQGLAQPLFRLPGQLQRLGQGHLLPGFFVADQGGDVAGDQVGAVFRTEKHQAEIAIRLRGVEEALILSGRLVGAVQHQLVVRLQLGQGLVDGGYPFAGPGQDRNLNVVLIDIVVLYVHGQGQVLSLGLILAGDQRAAQQDDSSHQDHEPQGRTFLFPLEDVSNAQLRLPG